MSGSREEERRKLADIINHWNANRLDLFEISQPTEVSPRSRERAQAARAPSDSEPVAVVGTCRFAHVSVTTEVLNNEGRFSI